MTIFRTLFIKVSNIKNTAFKTDVLEVQCYTVFKSINLINIYINEFLLIIFRKLIIFLTKIKILFFHSRYSKFYFDWNIWKTSFWTERSGVKNPDTAWILDSSSSTRSGSEWQSWKFLHFSEVSYWKKMENVSIEFLLSHWKERNKRRI